MRPGLLERMADRRAPQVERRDTTLRGMIEAANGARSGSWAGVTVTPESALTHATVAHCVSSITNIVAKLPIDQTRKAGNVRIPVDPPADLLTKPSGVISPSTWTSQLMESGLLHGNAYGVIVSRDQMLRPRQIELVEPRLVQTREKDRRIEWKIAGEPVPADDVWHVAWNVPTGKRFGRSLIEQARQTIGIGLAASEFSARWFGDGAHPTFKVKSSKEIDKVQAKAIKQRIIEATRYNREPIVLGDDLDIEAIQSTPADSELVATWARNTVDVASFFHYPPELAGGSVSSMTYANLEARMLSLFRTCIELWMHPAEEALSLTVGGSVKFNLDAELRSDTPSRYTAHEKGLRAGWLSANEVRALEDMAPIPDGDQYLWPPYTSVLPDEGKTP